MSRTSDLCSRETNAGLYRKIEKVEKLKTRCVGYRKRKDCEEKLWCIWETEKLAGDDLRKGLLLRGIRFIVWCLVFEQCLLVHRYFIFLSLFFRKNSAVVRAGHCGDWGSIMGRVAVSSTSMITETMFSQKKGRDRKITGKYNLFLYIYLKYGVLQNIY